MADFTKAKFIFKIGPEDSDFLRAWENMRNDPEVQRDVEAVARKLYKDIYQIDLTFKPNQYYIIGRAHATRIFEEQIKPHANRCIYARELVIVFPEEITHVGLSFTLQLKAELEEWLGKEAMINVHMISPNREVSEQIQADLRYGRGE